MNHRSNIGKSLGRTLSIFAALLVFNVSVQADCNDNILETTPTDRFIDNLDGTVTDRQTGLMWARCTQEQTLGDTGDCDGSVIGPGYTWEQALQQAAIGPTAGTNTDTDWRLPNIKELSSIVERACSEPFTNEEVFPNIPLPNGSFFWSSSPISFIDDVPEPEAEAWGIDFWYGNSGTGLRGDLHRVRLVRGGQ